ncbi:uncharacterized protein LOC135499966 [Lineus longissimus]|uniref:uncharacterized protein LOC135499966 n=1 Tax=Lineus longissimus TaxID=88925 RepID=UPI00315D4E19
MVNSQGQVHCSYVVGKARVTPIKTVTMPRLELTAAVMSAKASVTLGKELEYKVADELFWTDSQIVIGYIANEARRFGVFVANRVQQIKDRTETEQWKHVRGEENPADEGSRGLTVEEMKESKWLKGPGFLWEQELPKNTMTGDVTLSPDDPEVRKACVHAVSAEETGPSPLDDKWLRRFSSLGKAKRILALCLSFIQRCRNKAKGTDGPVVNVAALEESERVLVRIVQNEAFEEEIQALKKDEPNGIRRTSPLYHLDPYLDKEGIVRLGGRLRRAKISHKHPIILPKKSQLGKLVAYHHQETCAHGGRGMTINEIRANGYWILGIITAVSPLIHRCVRCRKARRNVETPKMADLPVDRIEAGEGPFECRALDIFGPWTIREKRSDLKRYGLMITCLAVRAVHIETLNSMTTDSFINALRRFCAIRGPCRLIRSDRGSNIAGADTELRKAWEVMDHEKIRDHLLTEGVDYHYMMPKFEMSFPKSSHMNGAVERQIRTVRAILNQLLQNRAQQLDDEAIRTFMAEAMAIVNCRPLTVENLEDPGSLRPLTPNHILTMKSRPVLPPPGNFEKADLYLAKRWRRVQVLAEEFWDRWRREFILNLQQRRKWCESRENLRKGDIVIEKDEDVPRNCWKLARITETHPSEDGTIVTGDRNLAHDGRRVKPLVSYDRPVTKLVLLLSEE